jgi:hypothetical protein
MESVATASLTYLDNESSTYSVPPDGSTSTKRCNPEGDNGSAVKNPESQQVPHLVKHFKAYGQPLHTLTQNNADNLPKTSGGKELCLSFHLHGQCFHVCKCCKTHQKLQSSEEESIFMFLNKCNILKL